MRFKASPFLAVGLTLSSGPRQVNHNRGFHGPLVAGHAATASGAGLRLRGSAGPGGRDTCSAAGWQDTPEGWHHYGPLVCESRYGPLPSAAFVTAVGSVTGRLIKAWHVAQEQALSAPAAAASYSTGRQLGRACTQHFAAGKRGRVEVARLRKEAALLIFDALLLAALDLAHFGAPHPFERRHSKNSRHKLAAVFQMCLKKKIYRRKDPLGVAFLSHWGAEEEV